MGIEQQMWIFQNMLEPYKVLADPDCTADEKLNASLAISNAITGPSYVEPPYEIMYELRFVLAETLSTFLTRIIEEFGSIDKLAKNTSALTTFCEVIADSFYNIGIASAEDAE